MVSRNYRNSSAFQSLINRMMRDYGINPDQAAMFLNTVMNVSDEETADTFRMSEADFSRLRRGSARYGRGLDEDFLRRLRGAGSLSDLEEEDQVLVNLLNASTNPLFPSLVRRGTDAVLGGEKDAIQRAAMDYVTTFYLGGGNPRGGVRRIEDAIQTGNTAYGTDASLYYRDQLLPRFERITNDLISGSPELASLRNGPSISPVRRQSIRDYGYGDLTSIAQDFSPNEFVQYDPRTRETFVNAITDPRTNDIPYRYWIPPKVDYVYKFDSPMYMDLPVEEADIRHRVGEKKIRRFLEPVNGINFYTEVEPFSSESALLNDSLEFVPEKIAELQKDGTIIPFSSLRFNREAYENLINMFRSAGEQLNLLPVSSANSLKETMRDNAVENFMDYLGGAWGDIARLRIQGLREGWLRRTKRDKPGWKGYQTINRAAENELEEDLLEERSWGPDKNRLGNENSPFRYVDPYENYNDVIFENMPDYGPEPGRDIPDDIPGLPPGPEGWFSDPNPENGRPYYDPKAKRPASYRRWRYLP